MTQDSEGLCQDVVYFLAQSTALTYGAVVVLAIINVIMTVILKRLTRFERHSAKGNENRVG